MPLRLRPGSCLPIAVAVAIAACGCENGGKDAASEMPACSLLTPEEVSVIFGKALAARGSGSLCEYALEGDRSKAGRPAVELGVYRDAATEAEVESAYRIPVGAEISSLGDWAFVVTAAANDTDRTAPWRRILEARRGPHRLTVGAVTTLDPDPGSLDASLAALARAAFWRLDGLGTKKSEK